MSKFSDFKVKYTEKRDNIERVIWTWDFEHVNSTKNLLDKCESAADVRTVVRTVFPSLLVDMMGLDKLCTADIFNAFATEVDYDVKKHNRVKNRTNVWHDYELRDNRGNVVAVSFMHSDGSIHYYRADKNGNPRFRATFKRLFYGISDTGFNTRERLQLAIYKRDMLKTLKLCDTLDFSLTCTASKGTTTVN